MKNRETQTFKTKMLRSVHVLLLMNVMVIPLIYANAAQDLSMEMNRWSAERVHQWYAEQPWFVGCNFTPSTAINQLEMWQADTFDLETIDRELSWAQGIGMNFVRVYLHDMLWNQDKDGFVQRIDTFLEIADKHGLKVMFVLLDGCWDPHPKLGRQKGPLPHVHNSGWVQSPHIDVLKSPSRHDELKGYVQGVISRYKDDNRILLWDLYNEPGNPNPNSYDKLEPKNLEDLALKLCKNVFVWAREVDPSQPLSICVWTGDWASTSLSPLNACALENSDVITYHNYGDFRSLKENTERLFEYQRPLICTEYLSRPIGSTFFAALPFFKANQIGACNWGLVAGKTQTQYSWETWTKNFTEEPEVWFHDIFRPDGQSFDENEAAFIRFLTSDSCSTNSLPTLFLDELDITKCLSDTLPAAGNQSVTGEKIKIGGREFERGIGVLAPSEFKIKLAQSSRRFAAWVGMNDEVIGKFPDWRKTVFKVFGDGKKIWDSGPVKPGDKARRIDIDVTGMNELELIFDATHFDFAQGAWADAEFAYEGQRPVAMEIPKREKYILTPPVSDNPQINGPIVFGVRPGNPVLYKIPVSGKKPMSYSVRNLPKGLHLDKKTGVISGRIEKAGDYTMMLFARNSLGKTQREFTLSVGDTICLTPPMGWNSWNCWGESVDDAKIRMSAKAMVESGLIDHGWTYINIDDCWQGPRNPETGWITSNEKFPDMKALADYVHSLGLKIGLYTCCGPLTCAKFTGSEGYEAQDIQTYAEWGFDYVKIDWCHCGGKDGSQAYSLFGNAIETINRDIAFSICEWGLGKPWLWGEKAGGNCWRTTEDIADNWQCILEIGFEKQVSLEQYSGPGHWNDPDMLVVGKVGWGPHLHDSRLTPDEQYTHISLWSLLASPMLIGCDLTRIDDFTFNLLTNDEVIAVNQDPLGQQTAQIMPGDTQIWARDLADGSKAVGLFNLTRKPQTVKLDFDTIGLEGKVKVRDLWRQQDIGIYEKGFSTDIAPHGVFLIRVMDVDQ